MNVITSLLLAAPPITALAFTPDGSALVVGSQAGLEVRAWPDLAPLRTLETKLASVHALSFSPDGTRLAVAGGRPSEKRGLELYAWPDGELVASNVARGDLVYAALWSPDGSTLACLGHDTIVRLHDARTGKVERELEGHYLPALCGGFTADGSQLVTAGVDRSLRVWDPRSGECERALENHTDAVRDLALRPSQEEGALPIVASVGDDRTLRLWQPTIGRMMRFARLEAQPLCVRWTPDGRWLVVSTRTGEVVLVDPDTVEVVAREPAIDGWAYELAIAPQQEPGGVDVVVAGERGQLRALRVTIPAADDTTERDGDR